MDTARIKRIFTAKSQEGEQNPGKLENPPANVHTATTMCIFASLPAAGWPLYISQRQVRFLGQSTEPSFTFSSASAGAVTTDQAPAETSAAADAAVGFGSLT
jgi:hypothetical protein